MAGRVLRVAHASDLHVLPWPTRVGLLRLLPSVIGDSKRSLGWLNLVFRRGPTKYKTSLFADMLADLRTQEIDHLTVSGDLSNLALESEFREARRVLDTGLAGSGISLSTIPGNHDIYCPRSVREGHYFRLFGDTLASDAPLDKTARDRDALFPFVRRWPSQGVALVGLCSALPRPLFIASGRVGRDQLARLRTLLTAADSPIRADAKVFVVHHPPVERDARPRGENGLMNMEELRDVIEAGGGGTILHGHTHRPYLQQHGRLLVVEAGCSTFLPPKGYAPQRTLGYNILEFADRKLLRIRRRCYHPGPSFSEHTIWPEEPLH